MNQLYDLAKKASNGDRQAFKELCSLKINSIYYMAETVLKDHHDAEDACQETLVKIYKYIHKLRDYSKINAWINRIVVNECNLIIKKRAMRKENLTKNTEIEIKEVEVDSLPEEFMENEDIKKELEDALNQLPPKRRMAFNMYYYDHMSYKEIAYAMDSTVSTVSTNIVRGREQIKKILADKKDLAVTAPFIIKAMESESNNLLSKTQAEHIVDKASSSIAEKLGTMPTSKSIWTARNGLKAFGVVILLTAITTTSVLAGTNNKSTYSNPLNINDKKPTQEKSVRNGNSKTSAQSPDNTEEERHRIGDVRNISSAQHEVSETFAQAINKGQVVFYGGGCQCGHLNPKKASIKNIAKHEDIKFDWKIHSYNEPNGKDEKVLYSGSGDTVENVFSELYSEKQDGRYLLTFECYDNKRNIVEVNRIFTIDTGNIDENQYG